MVDRKMPSRYKYQKRIRRKKKKNKKKVKKLRLKKWVIVVILLFFLSIFIYSIYNVYSWYSDNQKVEEIKEDVVLETPVVEKEDSETTETINPPVSKKDDYWDYIKMNLLEVDFSSLLVKNPDTVGFIEVKGTNINYPIVKTTNNSYYLSHAFDKSANDAGWVFMDYRNDAVNFNQNTIIYAHSRYNGTMFGSLKNILNSSWYTNKENHIIRLSTPTENTMWQVFSVYTIPKESYYITTTFPDDLSYQEFLNTIKSRSEVEFSGTVNTSDKILTLSTCKDNFGNRIVMHAKLIKKEAR